MNIYLFDENEIITFQLPSKKIGNFWMTDSKKKNVINIVENNNNWCVNSSEETKIIDLTGNEKNIILKSKTYYTIEKESKKFLLFADYLSDNTFNNYLVNDGSTIKVGKSSTCNIVFPLQSILDEQFTITYKDKKWNIILNENAIVYLNDKKITNKETICYNGDVINVYGFKIVLVCGMIFVNNIFNNTVINGLEHIDIIIDDEITNEEIENKKLYEDDDYFLKSPRIRKGIETYEMKIDSPPAKEKIQDTPLWVTLAPMLTMAASSTINMTNAITAVINNEKTFKESIPTILISISMLFVMLIWPFVTKKFQTKQKLLKEEERQTKYQAYINSKDKELAIEFENQKRTIEENLLSTDICYDMITNKRRTLWSRRNDQPDFLCVRVGMGDVKFDSNIVYHSEDFSMEEDSLKIMLNRLINGYTTISNVPIGYSFVKNILTCINGIYPKYITFVNNIILQTLAFHSYDDLKYVIFTNNSNKDRWEYLKESPYCFSDDKSIRFFATNTEEMQEVSEYLSQIYENRKTLSTSGNVNEKVSSFSKFNNGYFVIIVDDIDVARKLKITTNILSGNNNLGFSIIILEEKLSKVPSEVNNFIIIGEKTSTILDSTNNSQIKFIEETNNNYDMKLCCNIASNLPIYIEESRKALPNSITFLELYGVGKIEQLNVINRWKDNNPTKSLKTEIGMNTIGDPFMLDLHEKAHGPHGLIAGMTGSGKSEFIITYVLSMAVNYSPEEVAFVLIDYKGGGLAGAFVNSETGEKIPHVVGTITNLDKTEINRALASINSELRRRQEIFNEVRMQTGEGTIDIYKYQRLYRDGIIKEPIPHLIIVCDEFAELKDQQPDFMDDLISTARIGRSLGVHLILATQKPSGVVDGQIWSNAKFKICLKVQDKQDSMEMIRNDLAAELKNVGRFYLLVGYSEYFSIGQAAWAGAQYFPNNEYKKAVDKNLYMIDNVCSINKTITNVISKRNLVAEGEELTNIVKYLINTEKNSDLKIKQLWLDRIPNNIYIDELETKYNYEKENYVINPIIGEYDNPSNQTQGLLTIDFEQNGNTLIYGMNESGKDELVQTIAYSMLKSYSTDELNLYLVDFGAETLVNFKDSPQVGDVVINGDDEKIKNLSKMLMQEMLKRKKMFTAYGGNYKDYIKNSGKNLPNIIILINSIEILNELYMDIIDNYIPIIREGNKYGIYFIITTESQNSVKMKVVQSCKNLICLQLTNPMSYRDILGKTDGLVPSSNLGRGLAKIDKVCEFQSAFITKEENNYDFIKKFVNELLNKKYSRAPMIPVMPEKIMLSTVIEKYEDLNCVPIGIEKESLNVSLYDFKKKCVNVISSNEIENMKVFITNIIKTLSLKNTFTTTVMDACNFYDNNNFSVSYVNNNFDNFITSLKEFDNSIQDVLNKNNMNYKSIEKIKNNVFIVIGFDKFYQKLNDDNKKSFREVIANNKEYPKFNFILFDIPSGYKKYEYEDWYKNNFDTNNGIWIGPGLSQQFVLKISTQSAVLSLINIEHAIVVKNGVPMSIKTINEIK